MSYAAIMAGTGAIVLATTGAVFGVGVARLIWADDLVQARQIDDIRSKTEFSLRAAIATQEKIICTLKSRLGESCT